MFDAFLPTPVSARINPVMEVEQIAVASSSSSENDYRVTDTSDDEDILAISDS